MQQLGQQYQLRNAAFSPIEAAPTSVAPDERFCYLTVDVFTSPPTLVAITNTPEDVRDALTRDAAVVPLSISEMLPTRGLADAIAAVRAKPQRHRLINEDTLNICFSHAFGRCRGRYRGDPTTCQQLHVRPEALCMLRTFYKFPQRRYFLRYFTGAIPDSIRDVLTTVATQALHHVRAKVGGGADLPMPAMPTLLEFAFRDVSPTVGAAEADRKYREMLQRSIGGPASQYATVDICILFSRQGTCPKGDSCPLLHVRLHTTCTVLHQAHEAAMRAFAGIASAPGTVDARPPPKSLAPRNVNTTAQIEMRCGPPPPPYKDAVHVARQRAGGPNNFTDSVVFNTGATTSCSVLKSLERFLGADGLGARGGTLTLESIG